MRGATVRRDVLLLHDGRLWRQRRVPVLLSFEDADMLAAEAAYADMEAELQNELDNYESYHPGYDEYRFDLDEIGHDPMC